MPTSQPPASRPWRVIAYELTHELNRERVTQLSLELTRALEEQGLDGAAKEKDRAWKRSPISRCKQ
jgi:hypothetical protein